MLIYSLKSLQSFTNTKEDTVSDEYTRNFGIVVFA